MGEAKRKAGTMRAHGPMQRLHALFARIGVNPDEIAFYDSPAFQAAERADPSLLNSYAEWVFRRPRDPGYEGRVRASVPLVADILARRLAETGLAGTCLNASNILSRMLERSFVARGSANISLPDRTPRQLMSYLGLAPGERSTGDNVKRLGITKAGNARVRRVLVESAWSYRHVPRTSKLKHYVHERVSPAVRDIALKAQARLCARYRALSGRGKKLTVAVTAIARELTGFVWAIGREMQTG
jgi:hypothetical protein